jgi:hypothetical protein
MPLLDSGFFLKAKVGRGKKIKNLPQMDTSCAIAEYGNVCIS